MRALIRFYWFSVFTLLEWNLKIPLYAVYFLVATQFVYNWLFIGIALVIQHVDPRKGDATEQIGVYISVYPIVLKRIIKILDKDV